MDKELKNFEYQIREGFYKFTEINGTQTFLKLITANDELASDAISKREDARLMLLPEDERPMTENQLREYYKKKFENGGKKEDCWTESDDEEFLNLEKEKIELENELLKFEETEKINPMVVIETYDKKDNNYKFISNLFKKINEAQNKYMIKMAKRFVLFSSSLENIVETKKINSMMFKTIYKIDDNGEYIRYFENIKEIENLPANEYYPIRVMWVNDYSGRYAKTNK